MKTHIKKYLVQMQRGIMKIIGFLGVSAKVREK